MCSVCDGIDEEKYLHDTHVNGCISNRKFEEIYPPEVGEFVYITDDTYTKKQVLRMEHLILKVLSFDVAVPTVNCFVERFVMNDGADAKTKSLAMVSINLVMEQYRVSTLIL